ncbi:hypothetical protein Pmani_036841 [Petrolisthes manimaculis]|uniref:Uncharacterized protein n=1 Tax=Petrolisthes manimaculis TaxID=1843537 RepID=A0AAE1NJD9_9EUCA|nr:hypothetical protein Pmani_036841 [Petrolisthes manimaculis]
MIVNFMISKNNSFMLVIRGYDEADTTARNVTTSRQGTSTFTKARRRSNTSIKKMATTAPGKDTSVGQQQHHRLLL